MKFFAVTTLFVAAALAIPHEGPSIGVTQSQVNCGSAQRSCCPTADASATLSEKEHSDLLNLLGGDILSGAFGKFEGCSGLVGLLDETCSENIACCNNAGTTNQIGLVNVAAPCVLV